MAFQGNTYGRSGFDRYDHDTPNKRPKILLAVMGVTGVGKTSFINVARGGSRVIKNTLEPSTREMEQMEPINLSTADVILVDTPGFDNTETPDISVLDQFVRFLKETGERKVYLSGIIYLHRITDIRMSSSATQNIELLRILCGDHFLPRVTLVTTMWDNVRHRVGENREQELKSSYWADIIEHGGVYDRYDGTHEATSRIIERYLDDDLVSETGIVKSNIEQQVVDSHKSLRETPAGRFALENLREKVQQYEQKLERMRDLQTEMNYESLESDAAQILEEIRKGEEELESYKKMLEGSGSRIGPNVVEPRGPSSKKKKRDAGKAKDTIRQPSTSYPELVVGNDYEEDTTDTWNKDSRRRSDYNTDQRRRRNDNSSYEPDFDTDQLAEDMNSVLNIGQARQTVEKSGDYWIWDSNYRRYYHRNEDDSVDWAPVDSNL